MLKKQINFFVSYRFPLLGGNSIRGVSGTKMWVAFPAEIRTLVKDNSMYSIRI